MILTAGSSDVNDSVTVAVPACDPDMDTGCGLGGPQPLGFTRTLWDSATG